MHNSKLSLLALVSVGALAIASCGKDRRGNNTVIPKPKDAGPDAGDISDSGNPPLDSGVGDAGNNNNPDTGVDGGMQMAECAVNTDCTAPEDSCLNFVQATGLVQCAGENTCQCFQGCDPFVSVEQSGCPRPAEACFAAPGTTSPTPGVCVPDTGGGTQGQACTSMFAGTHPFEDYTGDSCNGAQNFLCHGSDPLDVAGTCARVCDTANGALCTSLDPNTQCVPLAPETTQGACLTPITDLGVACTNAGECQGGLCLTQLGGQCSHECGVTSICPQDTGLCVFIEGMLAPSCVVECTFGAAGDTMCSGINPNLICENVGIAICFPRCMDNTMCPAAAPTCNVTTGHCGP